MKHEDNLFDSIRKGDVIRYTTYTGTTIEGEVAWIDNNSATGARRLAVYGCTVILPHQLKSLELLTPKCHVGDTVTRDDLHTLPVGTGVWVVATVSPLGLRLSLSEVSPGYTYSIASLPEGGEGE